MKEDKNDPLSISFNRFMEPEDFTNPADILRYLLDSKEKGTVIGVVSSALGRTMIMTGIEDLLLDEKPAVILKPYDMHGYILPTTKLFLESIVAVRPFTSKFENPFVAKLDNNQNSMLA